MVLDTIGPRGMDGKIVLLVALRALAVNMMMMMMIDYK
jgi:hypothetical protein